MRWEIDPGARETLQDQIVRCVRRGVAAGELATGEQLPPAAELGAALRVDRNTVLAAYRRLRDDGVLEFRRGRGARVTGSVGVETSPDVRSAALTLIDRARASGLDRADLIRLIEELT